MQSINNICLHTHTRPSQILNRRGLADLHSSCDNNWCHLLCRNFHKCLPKAKLNEIELISFFKVLWMRAVHVTPFPAAGVWYVTAPLSAGTWRWEIWDSRKSRSNNITQAAEDGTNALSNFSVHALTFRKQVEGFQPWLLLAHPTRHRWVAMLPTMRQKGDGSLASY